MSKAIDMLLREQKSLTKQMERLVQQEQQLDEELQTIFDDKIETTDALMDIKVALEKLGVNTDLPTRLEGSE